jgi:hypothetical protein
LFWIFHFQKYNIEFISDLFWKKICLSWHELKFWMKFFILKSLNYFLMVFKDIFWNFDFCEAIIFYSIKMKIVDQILSNLSFDPIFTKRCTFLLDSYLILIYNWNCSQTLQNYSTEYWLWNKRKLILNKNYTTKKIRPLLWRTVHIIIQISFECFGCVFTAPTLQLLYITLVISYNRI